MMYGDFGYADEAWMPLLLDVERLKGEGDSRDQEYWKKFGWEALDVPDTATHVKSRMGILNTRFLANYGWRMLGYETMEQWQVRLQEKFDSVVDKYERAYELYEKNSEAMMDDALPGVKTTVKGTVSAGGKDSIASKSKYSDTPDSTINDSDEFAGTITKDDRSTSYGRTDTTDMETKQVYTGGQIMEAINRTIDGWMDVDTAFVNEFENLFSNILWA